MDTEKEPGSDSSSVLSLVQQRPRTKDWHWRMNRMRKLRHSSTESRSPSSATIDTWRTMTSSLQPEPSKLRCLQWSRIIRKSQWNVAFKLVQKLPTLRVKQSVSHYNSLISSSRLWLEALSHFQSLLLVGPPDVISFNALGGCSGTRWDLALSLIREAHRSLQQIDRITFNALLKSLNEIDKNQSLPNVMNSRWILGLQNMEIMNSMGIPLHRSTSTHILQAMSISAQWCQVIQCLSLPRRFDYDLVCCNVELHACSKAFQWRAALKLLRTFPQLFVRPDAVSYNMLTGDRWRHASVFLQEMIAGSIRATMKWYNRAGHVASSDGKWSRTVSFFRSANEAQIHPDAVTVNTCLLHLSARWDQALAWWKQIARKVKGDQVTHAILMSIKTWMESLAFLQDLRWNRHELSCMICSATIKTIERSNCWTAAFDLLQHSNADVTSYSATAACLQEEIWPQALCLMKTISQEGLQNDVISLNSVLSVLGRRWNLAAQVFERILSAQLEASQTSHCSVLHLLDQSLADSIAVQTSASTWQIALKSLLSFHSTAVELDTASYNAVLASCEKCSRWRECLCFLGVMDRDQDDLPDELTFNAVICILAETTDQSCALLSNPTLRYQYVFFDLAVVWCLFIMFSHLRCLWEGWVGRCCHLHFSADVLRGIENEVDGHILGCESFPSNTTTSSLKRYPNGLRCGPLLESQTHKETWTWTLVPCLSTTWHVRPTY